MRREDIKVDNRVIVSTRADSYGIIVTDITDGGELCEVHWFYANDKLSHPQIYQVSTMIQSFQLDKKYHRDKALKDILK